jgi:cell division protein FtsL
MTAKRKQKKEQPPAITTQKTYTITPKTIWKAVVTVASGITAIFALVFAFNTLMQPYYNIQAEIIKLQHKIDGQSDDISGNQQQIKKIKVDKLVLTKVIHILLQEAIDGSITPEQLANALQYLEDNVIYDVTDVTTGSTDTDTDTLPDDTQQAIKEITDETLNALSNLK